MTSSDPIQSILVFIRRLLGLGDSPTPPEPAAEPIPTDPIQPVTRKVSLIVFDPVIASENGKRLTQVLGWNDSERLVTGLISDLREISHGYANYEIVERVMVDDFPVKQDGFAYTGEEFVRCWRQGSGFHQPDAVDYNRIVSDHSLIAKINLGAIDEVWTVGFPYGGFYESRMAGPGAFWCNAPQMDNTGQAKRRFVIMAFNYERGIGEMLEAFGHRAESIMDYVFRSTPADRNLWKRFIRHQKTHPGQAEVGNVHFAPNSRQDYDWGNPTPVETRCRNWASYPDLTGAPVVLDCREWGSGDIRAHHKWWFKLMPHLPSSMNGISNNWWQYIIDPNLVR